MKKNLKYIFVIVALAIVFELPAVRAQSGSQLFLTWHAQTYVPSAYPGKALPTNNSRVSVSLSLIDGNKVVDLSGKTVYWYVNDNFFDGGSGVQSINLRSPEFGSGSVDVRVQLPDYGQTPLAKTAHIPVVSPQAVIYSPFPQGHLFGSAATVQAIPYYFNVANAAGLNFSWSVNGQPPTNSENPQSLTLNLGLNKNIGQTINILLTITNAANAIESATRNITPAIGQ